MSFSTTSRTVFPIQSRRSFSTSIQRYDHYKTLGVSQDASKAQIKSHFYRLSKKHHPDLSKDPESREVFTKLNEAYQVLVNDRDRRAYDRNLLSRGPPLGSRSQPYNPHAPPPRTPRATHAWEYSYTFRTAKGTYTGTSRSTGGFKRAPFDYDASAQNFRPFTRPHHYDILTGSRKKREEYNREVDKVRNVSMTFRAAQIFGFLAVAISLFGGYGIPGV